MKHTVIDTTYITMYTYQTMGTSSRYEFVKESHSRRKIFGIVLWEKTYPAHLQTVKKASVYNTCSLQDAAKDFIIKDEKVYVRPLLELHLKTYGTITIKFDTDENLRNAIEEINKGSKITITKLPGVVYAYASKGYYDDELFLAKF